MNILIVSKCASDYLYNYIFETRFSKHVDPDQKFFRNLIYGLSANKDCQITNITVLPVSSSTHKMVHWERNEIEQDQIIFVSPQFKNGVFSRFFSQRRSVSKEVVKWLNETEGNERFVICDPLVVHATSKVVSICHKKKCAVLAVVTDLPKTWLEMGKTKALSFSGLFNRVYNHYADFKLDAYDGYVWLTKQMNAVANRKGRPFVVIEGFGDVNSTEIDCANNIQLPKRFIMYAGGIHKVFRLPVFIEAFIKANCNSTDLLIFGDGDDSETIIEYAQKYEQIHYYGVVPSNVIKSIEKKAILLVNPRPSSDKYTSYSFPSKTLEYMCSGTATLSTRLPGIPEEYNPYLLWFENEELEAMSKTIKTLLSKSDDELRAIGEKARIFVEDNKTAEQQAKKIYSLYRSIT